MTLDYSVCVCVRVLIYKPTYIFVPNILTDDYVRAKKKNKQKASKRERTKNSRKKIIE